jgi:hypothetical protein
VHRPPVSNGVGPTAGADASVCSFGIRITESVDQDLTAGNHHQDQDEQQPRRPRIDAEAAAKSGDHTGQNPTVARAHQTLASQRLVDVIHGSSFSDQA